MILGKKMKVNQVGVRGERLLWAAGSGRSKGAVEVLSELC